MASVTIGGEDYQSFADLDVANLYLAGDVARAAGWATRTDEAKARGLVSASRQLMMMPWCDEPPEYDDAPSPVPEVTAMLAADLLAKPALFANATGDSNIKSVKAGSAQVEFFSPVSGGPPLPRALWDLLVIADLVCLGGGTTLGAPIITGISGGCRPTYGRYPWDWPIAAEDYG